MPTPDFIVELRRHVGTMELWLSGITAVVVRGEEVLLVRRADTGAWTPVSGIIDPGEEPAVAAVREVAEEAAIVARAERLTWVHVLPPTRWPNGDRARFLDLVFRCSYVSGEPYPEDGENLEAAWFRLDDLPPLAPGHLTAIETALAEDGPARFEVTAR